MKTLNKLSIGILAATLGLIQLSAQAEENNEVMFTLSVNESSPEVAAFVPTQESLRNFAVQASERKPQNMFANPFLKVEWETDISIELDDAELIDRTRI